jgi:hypothetical protein
MITLVFKVFGEVVAKFCQNSDLCRKFKSAQNYDSTNRSGSDSHKTQIANRLEPYYGPSESRESCLPKWYSGLPEFQPIQDSNVKIRSAAVLSRNIIQQ